MAELARRQHGVISTAQAQELGYARSTLADWASAGRVHRLHRGVYAVGHTDLSHRGHVMSWALACAPSVASHWTAAWLWGITRTNSSIHLTASTRRGSRRAIRVHYAKLTVDDVCLAGAIPLTSLARTFLDLASLRSLVDTRRLTKYLERAEEIEDDAGSAIFDLSDFDELLARTTGHRGHGPLSAALATFRPDPAVIRSELEREFRALVERAGLPSPAMNVDVHGYSVDAWWDAERFGVELDVFATHGSPLSFEEDRERSDDLLSHGVELTRVTDKRLAREPRAVMERLGGHLERRRREILQAPFQGSRPHRTS